MASLLAPPQGVQELIAQGPPQNSNLFNKTRVISRGIGGHFGQLGLELVASPCASFHRRLDLLKAFFKLLGEAYRMTMS
jgi:hypothetical protein